MADNTINNGQIAPREGGLDIRTFLLNGKNFVSWKYTITTALESLDLDEHVFNGAPVTDRQAKRAKTIIVSALDQDHILKIVHLKTAPEIWKRLESIYENKTARAKLVLWKQLFTYKIPSLNKLDQGIGDIQSIAARLSALDAKMDEEMLIGVIEQALPPSFEPFLASWELMDSAPSLDLLLTKVNAFALSLKDTDEKALLVQANSHKQDQPMSCNFCKKPGHLMRDCRKLARRRAEEQNPTNNQVNQRPFGDRSNFNNAGNRPQQTFSSNHVSPHNSYNAQRTQRFNNTRPNYTTQRPHNNQANVALDVNHEEINFMTQVYDDVIMTSLQDIHIGSDDSAASTWIADSGCSAHMTPHKEWMTDYTTFKVPTNIRLGDNSTIHAYGSGKIRTSTGNLTNVHFVPKLGANLFSITTATNNNIEALCTKDTIKLLRKGKEILTGIRKQGTYLLQFNIEAPAQIACQATTLDNWHQRFGHVGTEQIKRMIDNNLVDGLNIGQPKPTCTDCATNKCHKASHPTSTSPKAEAAGQILHVDTVGPINPSSLGNARFIVLAKDEKSSYRLIKCVKTKGEIPEEVKMFISKTEMETGNRVLQLVSDNGSEFTSERLTNFLRMKGINHRLSAAYTPQQNGTAEREVRNITEKARTILNSSKLSKELWAEAAMTATYVLNRTLNRNTNETCYQLWYGKRPNVKNLRIFGQLAIVLIPSVKRSKFDEKGSTMVFVGYTDNFNTYRFYNPASNTIVISCDAVFLDQTYTPPVQAAPETPMVNLNVESESEQAQPSFISEETVSAAEQPSHYQNWATSTPQQSNSRLPNKSVSQTNDTIYQNATVTSPKREEPIDPSTLEPIYSNVIHEDHTEMPTTPEPDVPNESMDPSTSEPIYDNTNYKNHTEVPPTPESESTPISTDDMRSLRAKKPINYKEMLKGITKLALHATIEELDDPVSFEDAMSRSDRLQWQAAMQDEIDSLKQNHVWTLVERPAGNIVTNRWVLKIKRKTDGSIDRYRARLVARGYSQRKGVDFNETYAPVTNMSSVRLLFAYAASEGLTIKQFDIKTAFLYGHLEEQVFMEQPKGFELDNNKVCLLQRSLYGLKQAPRMWNKRFKDFLQAQDLHVSDVDECIFYRIQPLTIIALYVDDGIILTKNETVANDIISRLQREFKVHLLDSNVFLGFQYNQEKNGSINIHQESYIKRMLSKFEMENCNTCESPITTTSRAQDSTPLEDNNRYREAIGNLLYAAITTRIDIAFAVNKACRKVENPTVEDWTAIKRIFRYLKGRENYGITYLPNQDRRLVAYCDADYAGCEDTSKSTTGFVILLAGGPITWKSKRQNLVTTSSTEAELVSLCTTVKEVDALRELSKELNIIDKQPTLMLCDNTSTIKIASQGRGGNRTRHIHTQAKFCHEKIEQNLIDLQHTSSNEQLADMLTKATSAPVFTRNRNKVMNTLLLLTCLVALVVPTSSMLTPVSSRLYKPIDKRVEIGITNYEIDFIHTNPCESITKHKGGFVDVITFEYQEWKAIQDRCTEQYQNDFLSAISRLANLHIRPHTIRTKRSALSTVWKAANIAFSTANNIVIGSSITNLVATVFTAMGVISNTRRIGTLEGEMEKERQILKDFQDNFELTKHVNQEMLEQMKDMAKAIATNQRKINELAKLMPELIWIGHMLQTKISVNTDRVHHIADKYIQGLVATQDMAELLNMTLLNNYSPEDTIFKSITLKGAQTINFNFFLREMAPDTTVHKVYSFKVWDRLGSETPILKRYTGYEYLIYNTTSDCQKAIDLPLGNTVLEECTEAGYRDPRLKEWETIATAKDGNIYPVIQVHSGPNFNYVYCYNTTITLGDETLNCPPFVFKIPLKFPFSVGNITHHPTTRKLTIVQNLPEILESPTESLFNQDAMGFDPNKLIDNLSALQRNLTQIKTNQDLTLHFPIYGTSLGANAAWIALGVILSFCLYTAYVYIKERMMERIYEKPKPSTNNAYNSPPPLPPKIHT